MKPEHPRHSPETFMENASPVQCFVSPALPMGPEERNRPRYGRPVRKANTDPNTPTNTDTPTDTQTPPPPAES